MIPSMQRFLAIAIGFAALALAGCAVTSGGFGGPPPKPKTAIVTDFVLSSDVPVIDRGFTSRLEHKEPRLTTSDRKPRTIARVNDEIVASIVATLREGGLDAQSGSEDSLTLSDEALLVSGRLRPGDPDSIPKKKKMGFGVGYDGVVADMTVSYFSSRGKQQLLTFSADAKSAGKPLTGKQGKAYGEAIANILTSEKSSPEKLSPEVELQARRIGRAAGERVLAYAREQGWLAANEGEAAAGVKLPKPKPEEKPAKKPPKPAT